MKGILLKCRLDLQSNSLFTTSWIDEKFCLLQAGSMKEFLPK